MNCKKKIVTSEYVAHGHPDKLADIISDSILQEIYSQDKNARTGIETMVKDNTVVLGGEVKTTAVVDYENIVRNVFKNIVVYPHNHNLTPENIKIINLIGIQSPEISAMVDKEDGDIGAGDQGFCVGYASDETETYMPLGVYLAKKICQRTAEYLGPDVKTQVVVSYDENGDASIEHILVSALHSNYDISVVRKWVKESIVRNSLLGISDEIWSKYIKDKEIPIQVNPYGEWKIGGPIADCGVTGRKIVVDQYGGYCNVGGGAFSGKDLSKVDRSAAYMARYIAKNIVASGVASNAKVELAYIIGQAKPCAFNIEIDRNCDMVDIIKNFFETNLDLTPKGIIDRFSKSDIDFIFCAKNGAFGYTEYDMKTLRHVPWEYTDLTAKLNEHLLIFNN